MSMFRQPIALPMPVPNALETASLPANRAARWRAGNFIDIEYSISPSVKTRRRNFSPNRSSECSMRAHSTRSTPIPSTLMCEAHCPFSKQPSLLSDPGLLSSQLCSRHSSVVVSHRTQEFLNRVFNSDEHRPRHDRVPNVQLCEMRDLVNKRDVGVIDPVPGVDLQFQF